MWSWESLREVVRILQYKTVTVPALFVRLRSIGFKSQAGEMLFLRSLRRGWVEIRQQLSVFFISERIRIISKSGRNILAECKRMQDGEEYRENDGQDATSQ